jgi:hypothetical protein
MNLKSIIKKIGAWLEGDVHVARRAAETIANQTFIATQQEIHMQDVITTGAATAPASPAADRVTTALQIAFALKNISPTAVDAAVHAATIAALEVLLPTAA